MFMQEFPSTSHNDRPLHFFLPGALPGQTWFELCQRQRAILHGNPNSKVETWEGKEEMVNKFNAWSAATFPNLYDCMTPSVAAGS